MSSVLLMSDCLYLFIVQAIIHLHLSLGVERVAKDLIFLQTEGSLFKFYLVMYLSVLTELKFEFGK